MMGAVDVAPASHAALADLLRRRVLEGSGTAPAAVRQMAAKAATGGPADGPAAALARRIGRASYEVSDAEVAAVRAATGSARATFEIIAAAAMGAGLLRWQQGLAAIEEAGDAAP
jgi:hypothetical protein